MHASASSQPADIVVDRLTKVYGTFTAVDHISFQVAKGTIFGFLGPNGAGKTTTIRMLTCYMPPTSGSAKVAGYDVFPSRCKSGENIGYLPNPRPCMPRCGWRSTWTSGPNCAA